MVVDKIPVTTRPRTMLDLAAVLPMDQLQTVLQDAVTRGLVKVEQLMAIVDRRGGRGVNGTIALRTGLEGGLVDEALESKLELLLAAIIETADVPRPTRQFELICNDGRRVVLDNAWPDRRITVEGDGRRWHGNAEQARTTRARSRSIVASGWQHYVYGWAETTETPHDVRRELESVLGPLSIRRAS
jgi:hypothetical protein